MGFHSHECIACGHPLLSHWVTNETNDWMRDGVVIHRDPKQGLTKGEYDGHGRLWYSDKYRKTLNIMGACDDATDGNGYGDIYRGRQEDEPFEACVYHTACWIAAGKPTEWKASPNADDQGYFFDHDHGHQLECPIANRWDACVWVRSEDDYIDLLNPDFDYDADPDGPYLKYEDDKIPGFAWSTGGLSGGDLISRAEGNPYGLCLEWTYRYLSDITRDFPNGELDRDTIFLHPHFIEVQNG